MARLAFLGTPQMAVPPLPRPGRCRPRHRPVRDPARPSPGAGQPDHAQPGQGGGDRVGHPGEPRHGRCRRSRGRVGGGRRLRADHPGASAGRGAHGQSPLLAAAPMARCRPGGTGHPGRRSRDRRLPDEGRRGARHRAGLRHAPRADRRTHHPRRAAGRVGRRGQRAGGRRAGRRRRRPARTRTPASARSPWPTRSPGRTCIWTGPTRRSSSHAWYASSGPGRRFGASASTCSTPR